MNSDLKIATIVSAAFLGTLALKAITTPAGAQKKELAVGAAAVCDGFVVQRWADDRITVTVGAPESDE